MSMKLIAKIESYGSSGYIAWIESMKGMVVQAETQEAVLRELLLSLKVKLSYDLGVNFDNFEEKEITEEEWKQIESKGEKEINFSFA